MRSTVMAMLAVAAVTMAAGCAAGSEDPGQAGPAPVATSSAKTPVRTTIAVHSPRPRHQPRGPFSLPAGATAGDATELAITPTLHRQLLVAGAAYKGFSVADYQRVEIEVYAHDERTDSDWAGGGLDANTRSLSAQVAEDDNGSYDVFWRTAGGAWHVADVALVGNVAGEHKCTVPIPADVLRLWHLKRGNCVPRQ